MINGVMTFQSGFNGNVATVHLQLSQSCENQFLTGATTDQAVIGGGKGEGARGFRPPSE